MAMHNTTVFDGASLKGRVAVVTGASRGIGLAICEQLRDMGAHVVQLDVLFAQEPAEANGMLAMRCDVADPDSIKAVANEVRARLRRCDVLVNNAGITATPAALEDFPIDEWDRVLRVNLRGALLCAQALVPMMFAARSGSIVNVASISARSPTRAGAYGASKAALRALTQQMAVEWGPRGVRANSVSPGMIRTPLSEVHYEEEGMLESRTAKIPARRIGQPQDIAGIVSFLASDAARYINGEDIVVDGGFLKASLHNLYSNP